MSLLIKGMEMPDKCAACPLRNQEFFKGKKYLYGCGLCKGWGTSQTRADDCPLVEVPTPHGRLIDADELTRYIEHAYGDRDIVKLVTNTIARQQTIVEAEE